MSTDKNLKPTHKKISDAREHGQVPVSRDLARLVSLTIVFEIAFGTEPLWHDAINSIFNLSLKYVGADFSTSFAGIVDASGGFLLCVFGALFLICSAAAVTAYWGQFGVLVAPDILTPNLDKLNPMNGIKQIFSKKKLGELALSLAKVTLVIMISYTIVREQLPKILQLSGGDPQDIYNACMGVIHSIFHVLLGLFIVLALIDFSMQRHIYMKSLNMDVEEMKQEYKESEGDPIIKGARKQLVKKFAEEGPVADTKDANAVVVNPTHFAVAMLFDHTTPVPIVLAKGRDEVAQAIIAQARKSGIPVIRHVWLARTLYATCRKDSVVPMSSYEAVAHVYAVVQELLGSGQTDRMVELERFGDA